MVDAIASEAVSFGSGGSNPLIRTYRQQKYSCCQLIAAINARIFLGGGDITDGEFEHLAGLVCCKNGAAIRVHNAYSLLGLEHEDHEPELPWIATHLPASIGYYDPKFGFHDALVVGVEGETVVLVNAAWDRIAWGEIDLYKGPHFSMRKSRTFKLCKPTV